MSETNTSIEYSIVIPVYNTTQVLGELQRRIEQVFSSRLKASYEILFVDDGSSNPGTWPAVEYLVRNKRNISGIRLTRNFGQHAALLCGLAHARGEYIITMDDDLQHAPEDIPALVSQQEHDVVIGQFRQKQQSPVRKMASNIKAFFDRVISGKPRNLRMSTFCLIRRSVVQQMLAAVQTPHSLFSSLIFNVTRDIVGIPVSHSARQEGKSGYSPFSLLRLFSRLFVINSKIIFHLIAWSGGLVFTISIVLLIGLIRLKDSPGWFFMEPLILLGTGCFLLILGIRGISLSRLKTPGVPQKPYLIRQRIP
jgi:glycosyltransferase involved in cell wall biosynthesis